MALGFFLIRPLFFGIFSGNHFSFARSGVSVVVTVEVIVCWAFSFRMSSFACMHEAGCLEGECFSAVEISVLVDGGRDEGAFWLFSCEMSPSLWMCACELFEKKSSSLMVLVPVFLVLFRGDSPSWRAGCDVC